MARPAAAVRRRTLTAKLDALTAPVGSGVPVVAACTGNRITAAGKQALKDRKIELLTVGGDKDAADKALLDEAARRARGGSTRFVVASHDSRFAQLADLGRLEIVVWANPKIAQKDKSRAARVHHVPRPGKAASAVQPPKPAAARSAPAPAALAPVPAAPDCPLPVTMPNVTVSTAAAAAAAVLTAGILFGAGTILGASAALRLLRRPRPAERP